MTSTAPRTLAGYSDRISVRPGDKLAVKVSRYGGPETYAADLVRVINGDAVSHDAGFCVKPIAADFAGTYPARHQEQHFGSYVEIPASHRLDDLTSFTVQAAVQPTFLPHVPVTNLDPDAVPSAMTSLVHEQTLIARWDTEQQAGWTLLLDEFGHPTFRVGDGSGGVEEVKCIQRLTVNTWTWLTLSYDQSSQQATLVVQEVGDSPGARYIAAEGVVEQKFTIQPSQQGVLRFGAACGGWGNGAHAIPADAFNGRLDSVRLSARVVSTTEAAALRSVTLPRELKPALIGAWDFARGTGTNRVYDESGNDLHGVAVNLPMRAIRGVHWDGSEYVWRHAPQHYSAIHFHSDDIYDVEWQTDFCFKVPDNLPSGVYAARLKHGDFTDYATFFVAPPKGVATNKVALLMSTSTYMAYSNVTMAMEHPEAQAAHYTQQVDYAFMREHPHYQTGGLYHRHVDGSQYSMTSRLRPILNMKPGGLLYNLNMDTLIGEWLEHEQIGYDIITDEQLDTEGQSLLENYPVVITSSHPEYYSTNMLDAIDAYLDNGGRLMYLGGNGFFWNTPFHQELPGAVEWRWEAAFGEMFNEFDGTRSGLWWESNRPPENTCGVSTNAMIFHGASAYRRQADAENPRAS
ncbi:MAG: N,N-dimethylformamidase beta subunit family domain-containing protein, partial [Pseudomonadales bacterium]